MWSQSLCKYGSIIVVGGVRPSGSYSGGWSQAQWKYGSIIVVGGVRPSGCSSVIVVGGVRPIGSSSVMVTGLVKVVVLHTGWCLASSPGFPAFFVGYAKEISLSRSHQKARMLGTRLGDVSIIVVGGGGLTHKHLLCHPPLYYFH